MIFDDQQQKNDFIEMLQKYPVPNALVGKTLMDLYLPKIQSAPVVNPEMQNQMLEQARVNEGSGKDG